MKVPYVDIGAQYGEYRDDILSSIDHVLKSGQYVLGPEVLKFEKRFAEFCEVKHAIGVADGTDALILSMLALGIKAGDEVITAPNSWISSASAIALTGATPVFCDVADDQNLDATKLEEVITKNTKAIIPVHLTGKIADMNGILEIARKHNLHVIEDAAQAVGAKYYGKKAGSMGITGCFSLHPLKNLNGAGDGGIVTTNDDAVAEKVLLLRNHGIKSREDIVHWGYNSRLDSIQAAILNVKFDNLDDITRRRRNNADIYQRNLPKEIVIPRQAENCFDVFHLFVIQVEKRDELKDYLTKHEIGVAVHYPTPIHLYKAAEYLGYSEGSFEKVESQSKRVMSLPIHQNLSEEQVLYVCNKIKEFYQK